MKLQKKAMGPMIQQSMAQAAMRMNLTPEEKDAFLALQKKGFDDMMAAAAGGNGVTLSAVGGRRLSRSSPAPEPGTPRSAKAPSCVMSS